MAQTVPQQHPAVVLRTHYVHLRVLLVAALIALVAMAAAVVVLATSDSSRSTGTTSSPARDHRARPVRRHALRRRP